MVNQQKWNVKKRADGKIEILSVFNQKCLDGKGTELSLQNCDSNNSQGFTLTPLRKKIYQQKKKN